MNKNNMHQVFANYIENFEVINNEDNEEYYKWQVCAKFKPLMDKALKSVPADFSAALLKVKECTENIIDSYTQPFYGLVEFARIEPETVQKMFVDLYSDDDGDLQVQMTLIENFFNQSNALLEKHFPGSHLYKQNSHSVSSYLFLYDPDHHYMYKATQSQAMADCIGFYDDWGTGDNIKLDVYYRMCDEILAEIKNCPELISTNKSRYDGRLKLNPGELHEDSQLHILLFDIIYCTNVYNLFEGISFSRPKAKEKQLIFEKERKAKELLAAYNEANMAKERLDETLLFFVNSIAKAGKVKHKTYGDCEVLSVNQSRLKIKVVKTGEEKQLGLAVIIANGIISIDSDEYMEHRKEYLPLLRKADSIPRTLEYALRALEPYEEYLDKVYM